MRRVDRREGRLCRHLSFPPTFCPLNPRDRGMREVLTQSTCRTTAPCLLSSLVKMSLGNSCKAEEQRKRTSLVQMATFSVLEVWERITSPQHENSVLIWVHELG
jgi:hypothetical protein